MCTCTYGNPLPGSLCAWSESTCPAVGMVNGRVYDDQQIDAICDTHGPCQTIPSICIHKSVFCWFRLFTSFLDAQMSRSSDFSDDNRHQTNKPITLPLAHARRVTNALAVIYLESGEPGNLPPHWPCPLKISNNIYICCKCGLRSHQKQFQMS